MTDAVEHWWCPACGTFDGPHHEELCDVCADGTGIDGLVPRAELVRLREDYKRELYEQAKQKSEAVAEIERLRGALRRYGEHDSACGVRLRRACTCGLAALRAVGLIRATETPQPPPEPLWELQSRSLAEWHTEETEGR